MMSVEEFGEALVRTGDLDPVYHLFGGTTLPRAQTRRWLTAYWMFYHVGVASWLSEQEDFWVQVRRAAENAEPSPLGGRWPRGAERRHFRGAKCVAAVDWFSQADPGHWVGTLHTAHNYRTVMCRVGAWPMHGPWIAFKAADMLERCLRWPVSFDRDIGLIYREPQQGLYLVAEERGKGAEAVYDGLLRHLGRLDAPPWGDRPCGPQEAETVLCKYKAYRGGHYWVGKDIHEVREALKGWGSTAARVLDRVPRETLRNDPSPTPV